MCPHRWMFQSKFGRKWCRLKFWRENDFVKRLVQGWDDLLTNQWGTLKTIFNWIQNFNVSTHIVKELDAKISISWSKQSSSKGGYHRKTLSCFFTHFFFIPWADKPKHKPIYLTLLFMLGQT